MYTMPKIFSNSECLLRKKKIKDYIHFYTVLNSFKDSIENSSIINQEKSAWN